MREPPSRTSPYLQDSYVFRSPAFFDAWSTDSGLRELKPTDFNLDDSKLKNLDVRVAIDPGEVDGKVLVTQDCRLVYYLIQVNDVYAYFLTGYKNGIIPATEFPTGEADLTMIEAVAGKRLDDRNALAVELKSAWIEFTESEAPYYTANYITMKRTIPIYNNPVPCSSTSSSTSWSPSGSRRDARLALIGMHVVFSVKGHPEMLWSTFEHVNNTPNEKYKYNDENRHGQKQLLDIAADHWMFSNTDSNAGFNETLLHFKDGNIVGDGIKPIGPGNIRRNAPWGSSWDKGDLNTEIIYANQQLIGGLAGPDVRKNYIMIGTAWTCNVESHCNSGGDPGAPGVNMWKGSEQLVNTTMETFITKGSSACFNCHPGPKPNPSPNPDPRMLGGCRENAPGHFLGTGLSHLFGVLQPLSGRNAQAPCTSVR